MPFSIISQACIKARADYKCKKCGSTEYLQAHAPDRDHSDWHKGVALCASHHADEHPELPRALFFTGIKQPYWPNISAATLAKEKGCHPRTVIEIAQRLNVQKGQVLLEEDKNKILAYHREYPYATRRMIRKPRVCQGVPIVQGHFDGKLDLDELAEAIDKMTRQQKIFKVLREELTKLGYWQNLPRGNPRKGHEIMVKHKNDEEKANGEPLTEFGKKCGLCGFLKPTRQFPYPINGGLLNLCKKCWGIESKKAGNFQEGILVRVIR